MVIMDKNVPTHKADLKEVVKPSVIESTNFYSEILGYALMNGKGRKYALAVFKDRYGHWPPKHVAPKFETSKETLQWIKHKQIQYAKSQNKRQRSALRTFGALDKRFTELQHTKDSSDG